jgi:SAM-dependent methyltransferase
MSILFLKSLDKVHESRKILEEEKVSFIDPTIVRWLREKNIIPGINIGDKIKSWDVYETTQFIRNNVDRSGTVLDIGAYACEVLPILHRVGYENLLGLDLNPSIKNMPYNQSIKYEAADFMTAPFEDACCDAVTAISVIEHGYNSTSLFGEVSRLLKVGGYFIASFDYWPIKINTDNTPLFGMSWTIFAKNEVMDMVQKAGEFGLKPLTEIVFEEVMDAPILFEGRKYTFAWIVLQKKP